MSGLTIGIDVQISKGETFEPTLVVHSKGEAGKRFITLGLAANGQHPEITLYLESKSQLETLANKILKLAQAK